MEPLFDDLPLTAAAIDAAAADAPPLHTALRELAPRLALALDPDEPWQYAPADRNQADWPHYKDRLIGPDGLTVVISGTEQSGQWRLLLQGVMPRDYANPWVTVAADRAPSRIAARLRRDLLPRYRTELADARAFLGCRERERTAAEAAATGLAHTLGAGAEVRAVQARQGVTDHFDVTWHPPGLPDLHARFTLRPGSDRCGLEVNGLDPAAAAAIAAALHAGTAAAAPAARVPEPVARRLPSSRNGRRR